MQDLLSTMTGAPGHGIKLLNLAGAIVFLLGVSVDANSYPVLRNDSYATAASSTVHGAESNILIGANNTGFLQYGLGLSLPAGVTGSDIDKAILKVYISSVNTIGNLTVRAVDSVWAEDTLSGTNVPTLAAASQTFAIAKSFEGHWVQLDVTDIVRSWTNLSASNYGLALSVEGGSVLNAVIDSKENTGTGHEAILDVVLKSNKYTGTAPIAVDNVANTIGLNAATNANDLMTWDGVNWVSKPLAAIRPARTVNNMQPYTTVNFIIALVGIFPAPAGIDPYIGEIGMVGFNFAPTGWALCNGQLLSTSANSPLFAVLNNTYGGDGVTTFALPDLRGRAPIHQGQGPGLTNRVIGEKAGTETEQDQ